MQRLGPTLNSRDLSRQACFEKLGPTTARARATQLVFRRYRAKPRVLAAMPEHKERVAPKSPEFQPKKESAFIETSGDPSNSKTHIVIMANGLFGKLPLLHVPCQGIHGRHHDFLMDVLQDDPPTGSMW